MLLSILLSAIITYVVAITFGYFVHKFLHQEWAGRFHKMHMTHHMIKYPPEDFISDVYRGAEGDNTLYFFAVAAIPVVALPIILCLAHVITLVSMITSLTIMVVMSFLNSYLHDSFHIRNHWLYRIPFTKKWFTHLVYLHWLHHVDMQTNFGIFVFHWDKVLGTFWNRKE